MTTFPWQRVKASQGRTVSSFPSSRTCKLFLLAEFINLYASLPLFLIQNAKTKTWHFLFVCLLFSSQFWNVTSNSNKQNVRQMCPLPIQINLRHSSGILFNWRINKQWPGVSTERGFRSGVANLDQGCLHWREEIFWRPGLGCGLTARGQLALYQPV